MKKFFIISICIAFFASCSSKEEKHTVDISQVSLRNITKNRLSFNENEPLMPKGCLLIDSLLVIYEPKFKNGIIGIYDLNNKELVKRFGQIGQGPNDFLNTRFLPNLRSDSSKHFFLGDVNHLYAISIDSLLTGANNINNYIVSDIPKDFKGYNYLLKDSKDEFIANVTGEYQLSFYDKKANTTTFKNYFDKEEKLSDISQFSYVNNFYDAYYTSSKDIIAVAYKNLKKIDLISTSTRELIKSINFPEFDTNLSKIKKIDHSNIEIDNGILFYTYVYPAEDKFYALCWDSTKDKIKKGEVNPMIYVFDWDGNLLERLQTDTPISYFCVDKSSKKIYAIGQDKESLDLGIYEFDIY